MLHIRIEESGKTRILRCTGKIVRGDETKLLCATTGQYGRNIILDLSQVEAIDAAGVGALISLQAAGLYLQLMNPTKAIREVLRVTKLDSLFEICSVPLTASHEHGEDAQQIRPSGPFLSPVAAPAT